jgi:hypothetical protein
VRWAWHEKPGTRKGLVIRHSDRLTPTQEEEQERERHRRDYDYIVDPHHPDHLYETMRVCGWCGKEEEQRDMRWMNERWKCSACQGPIPMRPHSTWLLDKPKPT